MPINPKSDDTKETKASSECKEKKLYKSTNARARPHAQHTHAYT